MGNPADILDLVHESVVTRDAGGRILSWNKASEQLYGWPRVEGRGDLAGFRNPQVVWRTEQASPSGLAWAGGRLWLASLRGERLWRIDVTGDRASDPEDFFVGRFGRMRTVVVAPDGNLWVATSNRDGRGTPEPGDDQILLVSPGS